MMKIISKVEAKSLGLPRYFTGQRCRSGHIAERTVRRDDCIECIRERKKAWARRNAGHNNEKSRAWYAANKEKATATRTAWRERNAEKFRADVAAYQAANKEKLKITNAAWRRANPEKVNKYQADYRAARLQATPVWANDFFIEEAYSLAKQRERICGGEWHVDHQVPLQSDMVCGLHAETNLQVIPGPENWSKSNRYWPNMPI